MTYQAKYQDLLRKATEKPLEFSVMEVWDALLAAEQVIASARSEIEPNLPKPDAVAIVGKKSLQLSYFGDVTPEEAKAAFDKWLEPHPICRECRMDERGTYHRTQCSRGKRDAA